MSRSGWFFAGEHLLRVWPDIEQRGKEIQAVGTKPSEAVSKSVSNDGQLASPILRSCFDLRERRG
jgi:hypothetical protein